MKIHGLLPSGRVVSIFALKSYLALDCELEKIDSWDEAPTAVCSNCVPANAFRASTDMRSRISVSDIGYD